MTTAAEADSENRASDSAAVSINENDANSEIDVTSDSEMSTDVSKKHSKKRRLKTESKYQDTEEYKVKPLECTICYEPCTKIGKHRLSALKCGHLFGKECIERWVRERRNCPNCNVRVRKLDIIPLYSNHAIVVDNSEIEGLREKYLLEINRRLQAEVELSRCQSRLEAANVAVQDYKELFEYWKNKYDSMIVQSKSQRDKGLGYEEREEMGVQREEAFPCKEIPWKYRLVVRIALTNSRVFQILPSCEAICVGDEILPLTFGIKVISTLDANQTSTISIHQSTIRDLKVHGDGDLILTTAFDATLAVSSIRSQSIVAKHELPVNQRQGWSCCFGRKDSNTLFCGFRDGCVAKYDLRKMDSRISVEQGAAVAIYSFSNQQPIHSLSTFLDRDGSEYIAAASFNGWSLRKIKSNELSQEAIVTRPINGSCSCLTHTDDSILISTRTKYPYQPAKHIVHRDLNFKIPTPSATATLLGHSTHPMLCRSAIWKESDDSLYVASGDSKSKRVMIWDVNSGNIRHTIDIQSDQPVLDIHHSSIHTLSFCGFLRPSELVLYAK